MPLRYGRILSTSIFIASNCTSTNEISGILYSHTRTLFDVRACVQALLGDSQTEFEFQRRTDRPTFCHEHKVRLQEEQEDRPLSRMLNGQYRMEACGSCLRTMFDVSFEGPMRLDHSTHQSDRSEPHWTCDP
ncbi:uncharacterized protein V6R79_003747 [Siganus canaliculatus]